MGLGFTEIKMISHEAQPGAQALQECRERTQGLGALGTLRILGREYGVCVGILV